MWPQIPPSEKLPAPVIVKRLTPQEGGDRLVEVEVEISVLFFFFFVVFLFGFVWGALLGIM